MIKAVQPVRLDEYRSRKGLQKPGVEPRLARARGLTDLSSSHAEALLMDLADCVDDLLSDRESLFRQATENDRPVRSRPRFTLIKGGRS